MLNKLLLTYNTIKYLKPIQLAYQLRLKVIKLNNTFKEYEKPDKIRKLQIMIKELDLDHNYLNRFDVNKLLNNEVLLLNELHTLDYETWHVEEASHLWNFNLHYLEYAIPLAAEYYNTRDEIYYYKFKEIIENWIECNLSKNGDAWHPYTISIRLPNLLISLNLFGDIVEEDEDFQSKIYRSIYNQYQFLLKNKEKHLLGNHYFENLKTIIICAVLFDDKPILYRNFKELKEQINEQILNDGVHFELSVMYHKIILEDIIRIAYCTSQYNTENSEFLIPIIEKMINAVISLEKNMGKIPHFNDSADGISKETFQLESAAEKIFRIKTKYINEFTEAGYLKYYDQNLALLFDFGHIGPSYMPGHGHCDALSFELSLNNSPVFVNSGTYNYQSEYRRYFRSTEAHNTFMLVNDQQSECWGEHRVARRINNLRYSKDNKKVKASFESYLGNNYEREISLSMINKIIIKDSVKTKAASIVQSYLHLAPKLKFQNEGDGIYSVVNELQNRICKLSILNCLSTKVYSDGELSYYSNEFGILENINTLEIQWSSKHRSSEIIIEYNI